ncbi:hypothetical protein [Sphingomonas sp. PAMC 26617]|uniref:hypothetical protein n=1 Tax=Sphingomonas sp. PAMC 26617 TaxID=1112216 RepID=UPI00028865CE|nr:hypothetical protein [Sphingomonas sp. PAMC 26617]
MNGGSRIIDLRPNGRPKPGDAPRGDLLPDPQALSSDAETMPMQTLSHPDDFTDEEVPRRPFPWLIVVGVVLSLGWIGVMTALCWSSLLDARPIEVVLFLGALCVPPTLVGILLLLALRTSTAEARRFGRTAQAMRAEAANLERTVNRLSTRIDDHRIQLTEQTEWLGTLGDTAVARLAGVGNGLRDHIASADSHATTLAKAAENAQTRLDVLLALLPRAHGETDALAQVLKATGITASEHAAALDAQLSALAERGREADAVANGAAQKLAAHITRMEATSETAGARLEQVTGDMSLAVDGLLNRTADAIDESRRGIAAQGDALLAMLGTNQAALERVAHDSADGLASRIHEIESLIEHVAARLDAQRGTGGEIFAELDHGIAHVSGRFDALHAQGIDRSQALAASIGALGGSAHAMTEALRLGDTVATTAIETTERLLLALDAAAREIDETLPDALTRLDTKVADTRRHVGATKPELLALVTAAESTHDAIEAIAHVVANQRDTVDKLAGTLIDTLSDGKLKADALGQMVDDTIGQTNRFADEAAPRLVEALLRVRDTASAAADRARETLASVIPDAALAFEQHSAAAVERAATRAVQQQLAAIADAADAAADTAARASERLEHRVAALSDASAILETRFEDDRLEREAADQNSMARRVSLLIEALNSASIDIAKTFAADVSDSAWSAYLKGDRGVFTRRAVRLLDSTEAREIVHLYDEDDGFREHVNRYIHDFESMLRAILSGRDGSPLGVTLLSSDMGKLYVALAQAIERLRT